MNTIAILIKYTCLPGGGRWGGGALSVIIADEYVTEWSRPTFGADSVGFIFLSF